MLAFVRIFVSCLEELTTNQAARQPLHIARYPTSRIHESFITPPSFPELISRYKNIPLLLWHCKEGMAFRTCACAAIGLVS